MATLESLDIKALAELSDEELLNHIRETRGRRRTPPVELKQKAVKKAIAKKSKAAEHTSVATITKDLSPEQKAELLAELLNLS